MPRFSIAAELSCNRQPMPHDTTLSIHALTRAKKNACTDIRITWLRKWFSHSLTLSETAVHPTEKHKFECRIRVRGESNDRQAQKDLILNVVYRNLPDTLWIHCWCECYWGAPNVMLPLNNQLVTNKVRKKGE